MLHTATVTNSNESDFKAPNLPLSLRFKDNIKDDCGNTPLIAVCQQTTVQNEEEAVKFVNYLWQRGSKFKKSNDSGKTAMNYAESNGLMKIIETLQYIQWKILHNRLQEVYII